MNNLLALVGSGEYLPSMDAVDEYLLATLPHKPARVVCVPTAAGDEGEASFRRWAEMGVAHFTRLGAEATSALIHDRASANDAQWAALIEAADLIYFSGGDPLYLCRTLEGTRAWAAAQAAFARGAIYAGCSAGAMMLGAFVPNVRSPGLELYPAFNHLPNAIILPHFDQLDSFRPGLTAYFQSQLTDGQYGLGIDEHTALIGRVAVGGTWQVHGRGGVSVIKREGITVHHSGQLVILDF
jgi:cyanophycinase